MATFRSFEDIEAWQIGRELTRCVYDATRSGPFARDYGLRDQIRRAAISIMSNIAEGFERSGRGEFVQFLAVAKGSAGEVRSHLFVARDLGYVSADTYAKLSALATQVGRMTNGLIDYLRGSDIRGTKYKTSRTVRKRQLET